MSQIVKPNRPHSALFHHTLALETGIRPKIVSERLGRWTVSLTLDIDSHAIPHLQEEAADQVGSADHGAAVRHLR
jgi:hypothetical protein